jgi:hypothetical protein
MLSAETKPTTGKVYIRFENEDGKLWAGIPEFKPEGDDPLSLEYMLFETPEALFERPGLAFLALRTQMLFAAKHQQLPARSSAPLFEKFGYPSRVVVLLP